MKCYFKDARGLRAGATVRLAGVDVGTVKTVQAKPELRDHPAEVIMLIQTPYGLRIPNDSVVTLETAGVLGEVFPEIDVRNAVGPPVQNDGVLIARPSEAPTPQEWMECLSSIMQHKPCDLIGKNRAPEHKDGKAR